MTELVRYEVAGGIATLTMDSHHNRNALSAELLTGLLDGIRTAAADDSVRVLVLSHTGTVFCSGVDLKSAGGPAASVTPGTRPDGAETASYPLTIACTGVAAGRTHRGPASDRACR